MSQRVVKNRDFTPMIVEDLMSNVEETKEETNVVNFNLG
jgi:hypothetical protein